MTPKKRADGTQAQAAGGHQYAKHRYTTEIGKLSTIMVRDLHAGETPLFVLDHF